MLSFQVQPHAKGMFNIVVASEIAPPKERHRLAFINITFSTEVSHKAIKCFSEIVLESNS